MGVGAGACPCPSCYGVRRLDAVLDYVSSGLARNPAVPKGGHALTGPAFTIKTGTQAAENGVEPPYSITIRARRALPLQCDFLSCVE